MKFEVHEFEESVVVAYGERGILVDKIEDGDFGITFCVPANGDFSPRSKHIIHDETHVVTALRLSPEGVDALLLALNQLSNK